MFDFWEIWSDGRKHALISLLLVIPSALLGYLLDGWKGFFLCSLGCLSGIVISPDLDQTGITFSESIWLRIPVVGWFFMAIWVAYWMLYSVLFKHRGYSHWVLLGTFTRIIYIFATILLIQFFWDVDILSMILPFAPMFIFGLAISDLGHWIRDTKFGTQRL